MAAATAGGISPASAALATVRATPMPSCLPCAIPADGEVRVYYAAYGCNMLEKRLMACLAPESSASRMGHSGWGDESPPTNSFISRIPYPVIFAHDSSAWGGGGLAFLDARPQCHGPETPRDTYIRAYCINLEQFGNIAFQENGGARLPRVSRDGLRELVARGPGAGIAAGRGPSCGFYGYLLFLGCHTDGLPILTYTCAPEEIETDSLPFNLPGQAYRSAMSRGLAEAGVPGGDEYVEDAVKRTKQMISRLSAPP